MQLQEDSISPPLYLQMFFTIDWFLPDFIFSSHSLHLSHITANDWYERYPDFYSIGVAPPNLGLTLKSRYQTHHSYAVKLTEMKFRLCLKYKISK